MIINGQSARTMGEQEQEPPRQTEIFHEHNRFDLIAEIGMEDQRG